MLKQRALEAFHAVMDVGSVTGAAHVLGISQPAVSRLVRELEHATGLALFARDGNRLVPTEAARLLIGEVDRAFVGLSAIDARARQIALGFRRSLHLVAMPVLAACMLPGLVADLHAAEGRVTGPGPNAAATGLAVDIEAARVSNAVLAIKSRRADLGFVTPLGETPEVATVARHGFGFECIMCADHPLAVRDRVRPEDLSGRDLVGYAAGTATGRMLERLFAQMPRPPRVQTRSHLSLVVSALALEGLGVAVVDPIAARDHRMRGGASRPMDLDERFLVSVIAPLGSTRSPQAERIFQNYLAFAAGFGGQRIV